MEKRLARLEAQSDQTAKCVQEIHAHVVGSPGTDGLTTRVAKVEQRGAVHTKLWWTAFTAAMGMFLAKLKGWV